VLGWGVRLVQYSRNPVGRPAGATAMRAQHQNRGRLCRVFTNSAAQRHGSGKVTLWKIVPGCNAEGRLPPGSSLSPAAGRCAPFFHGARYAAQTRGAAAPKPAVLVRMQVRRAGKGVVEMAGLAEDARSAKGTAGGVKTQGKVARPLRERQPPGDAACPWLPCATRGTRARRRS